VPEDHVVLLWDESIVNVQIGAADRGRGHAQDNVLRIFDPGIVDIVHFDFTGMMEYERFHYFFALPGFPIFPCCFASSPDGVTAVSADWILFFSPLTTSPSPFIIASKPTLATSAGSSFLPAPIFVSTISARSKNSVSVAPGIRQVTVTPESFSSSRKAKENESMNALVPL